MRQVDIDKRNSEFWNALCGTNDAIALGISDRSHASLEKFDNWFFDFYPYLDDYIPYSEMSGRRVLEVGLGYGSVGQKIAKSGADYHGLDVALGPVEMMNYRLFIHEVRGQALLGSILDAPFADSSFDYIVAIGCYHHTGNLQRALDESHRLLRPGGHLVFMVYNGLSYRQWHSDWKATLWHLVSGRFHPAAEALSARYDHSKGETAPHTDFVCQSSLRRLCRNFRSFKSKLENITSEPPFKESRGRLLATIWPRLVGLDIYATAIK